jgi:hypothetical protein
METKTYKHTLIGILANWLIGAMVLAQAPSSFKYQAVLRDGNGNIKASVSANIRIDILQGSATGTNVFAETFAVQTNAFGVINIEIGNGTLVSGNFSTIDWSAGPYFVKISVDGAEMGTSQLLSVPYAKYAEKAAETDPIFITSVANNIKAADTARWSAKSNFNGDYNSLTNKPTVLYNAKYNTATGYNALNYPTGGGNNTANGFSALHSNLTGTDITAIGCKTLQFNTSGGYNTAVGSMALYLDTSGRTNTAVGALALYSNTSGKENTAIGVGAMNKHIKGDFNTAVGVNAIVNDTTGSQNVALGHSALFHNTTGSNNVAIGLDASFTNTTGSNNTIIGYLADVSSADLTNATAIGNGADVAASNNMVFGNSNVTGWGFGVSPGTVAIKVGSTSANGNGANLTKAGVWTNASDSTKKYNIQPINYGLKEVMKLKPVSYQMKGTNNHDIGFIAQEVKLILPELVYGKEGEMTLSYGQITAVLTKAMQEQQKQIESQNKQMELQNQTIANQQKQIDELKQLIGKLTQK